MRNPLISAGSGRAHRQGTSMSRLHRLLLVCIVAAALGGCHAIRNKGLFGKLMEPAPLRVGLSVDAPPLAYKKDNAVVGLEMQFATGLAASIDRKLEVVTAPRQELAQALLDKKVDIVMAGMSVAEAHKQKLAATNPYIISGQVALVHLDDFKQLGSGAQHLVDPKVRLGVVDGSSGDNLVKGLKPKGATTRYPSAPEALRALITDSIDVFVFDLPANFYYASLFVDKGLTPGVTPLTREPLAWAVRPDDAQMRDAANGYLAGIEKSGELQKMLERAIPFYRNTAYSPKL
jgi:polar amino acid transport system substrate-binding protein